MTKSLPARSEIPIQYTWDTESVFSTPEAWEAEFDSVSGRLPDLAEFRGHLAHSPAMLADWFQAADEVGRATWRLWAYANMRQSVDTADQEAAARSDRMRGLAARVDAATAFAEPEMLDAGLDRLRSWTKEEPRLAIYGHYFDRLERRQPHLRSAEVEEILGQAGDTFATATAVHGILANAELRFGPARDSEGQEHEVAQGTINALLASPDRELRRTAWENYADAHLGLRNTMAACIATGVKRDVFLARARAYESSLHAALGANHIPVEVFHNLIDNFKANLPTWHRYWRLRRQALSLDPLQPYDIRARLGPGGAVSYDQAIDWVLEGVRPMGEEYVEVLRKGLREQRWVDVYPNRGKRMGAFSMGAPGTHPFIFMSFNDDVFSMSTLAHETGHSMHSYYARRTHPFVYARYGLFVAEVASNFHQALVRRWLLESSADAVMQIAIAEEAMANFYRYFFIMPTLARLELDMHQRVEQGGAVTADYLTGLTADLIEEVYGGEVASDRDRTGITWAQFHSHLYSNFYVYQYATGIAGANALADRVMAGDGQAAVRYLEFLKAGASMYPLDALHHAGVDLASPEPVERAFTVLAATVDRLEGLLGQAAAPKG
jgi:oligoendopeptidase F